MSQLDIFKTEVPKPPEPQTWQDLKFWSSDKFQTIMQSLEEKRAVGVQIFPAQDKIFTAFDRTPLDKVRVVILGQDPYHTPGKAHGLAFSVPTGVSHPPSLRNIFLELREDMCGEYPVSGDLTPWAEQGVFLLNTILTVEQGIPLSHIGLGWGLLVTEALRVLIEYRKGIVFILWGNSAIGSFLEAHRGLHPSIVPQNSHEILRSVHPSPMSAASGFFGSRPFSKTNDVLVKAGKPAIEWCLK